ncbi:hypothetical protein HPP92_022668 [Vanilla planifolia]|uniref:Ribosomal protein L19 n=1 Tax=Vanilla planifolia TaxID=51239 RepID=A0A835UFJ0_VANPL|nr:hypothetical protein HPP92_022668 [Vanilla planifolia]
MQALWRSIRGIGNRQTSFEVARFQSLEISPANSKLLVQKKNASTCSRGVICLKNYSIALSPRNHLKNSYPAEHSLHLRELMVFNNAIFSHDIFGKTPLSRCMTTLDCPDPPSEADRPHVKFKRLDKTAKHIMNILDKEAVDKVKSEREIPDIRPGYIIQLKVEVPENKRRISTLKGIVIARRNAGLNSTFRLRRLVAGVGVESVFPLYSPNIKEMKVLDKKKVRRAKLYYLRDRMNPLKK